MHRDSDIQIKDSFLPGSGVEPQFSNPFNHPLNVQAEEMDEVYEEEDVIDESYHNDSQIEDNYDDGLNDDKARGGLPVVQTVKDNDLSYSHHPMSASIGASFNKPAIDSAPKIDESIKDSYINQSFQEEVLEEEEVVEEPVTET